VLLNLMTNAREACEGQGDRRIVVRTRFASGIQVHSRAGKPLRLPIEVRVSDNGPGIDPACATIFLNRSSPPRRTGRGWAWHWCRNWCAK
jgi:two-component system nitrogen regulation sensor histidine kinase GlnL